MSSGTINISGNGKLGPKSEGTWDDRIHRYGMIGVSRFIQDGYV